MIIQGSTSTKHEVSGRIPFDFEFVERYGDNDPDEDPQFATQAISLRL
jgi:hypothetical protein